MYQTACLPLQVLLVTQIAAVVSQPGKPKGRGNKKIPIPSPVEQLARESGVADEQILCPASAKDVSSSTLPHLGCLHAVPLPLGRFLHIM